MREFLVIETFEKYKGLRFRDTYHGYYHKIHTVRAKNKEHAVEQVANSESYISWHRERTYMVIDVKRSTTYFTVKLTAPKIEKRKSS